MGSTSRLPTHVRLRVRWRTDRREGRTNSGASGWYGDVGRVEVNDAPCVAFAPEDDRTASEAVGVAELEGDKDDTGCLWLDAEVLGREAVKRWTAGGVGSHVVEHGAERGVDRGAAGHTLGHVWRGMEDGGGVTEGGTKRLPPEILERSQEATQRNSDGRRVTASGGVRLGTDRKRQGEQRERGNDDRPAPEETS